MEGQREFKTALYIIQRAWIWETKHRCDTKILCRALWLHLSLFFWWFGLERRHNLQSITSIQPQRGHKNINRNTTAASACHQSLRKRNTFCLQTVDPRIYFRKPMGGYNYAPSSACLPGLFKHQFLIAGPDKAHYWLTYRTNTHPCTQKCAPSEKDTL